LSGRCPSGAVSSNEKGGPDVSRSRERAPQVEIERLNAAVATPLLARAPGSHHIVVACPKGGTAKTTTAAMLGLSLAELRGEIVSVVDANLHLGTLRRRLVSPAATPTRSFRELCTRALDGDVLPEWSALAPYTDVVAGLRVLRSRTTDSARDECLSFEDFGAGIGLLRRAAQIVISDVGTSANGPVGAAALECASTLVLATELAYDSLELTIEMVSALAGEPLSYRPDPDDWSAVSNGRFAPLVQGAIVVVAPGRADAGGEDVTSMVDWLRVVCGGRVFLINRDDHLALGDLIVPSQLQPETAVAYLRVAAAVAARFPLGDG
jgi:MinD-like ATPase involved in chromosome partitioning or flagellar assembly